MSDTTETGYTKLTIYTLEVRGVTWEVYRGETDDAVFASGPIGQHFLLALIDGKWTQRTLPLHRTRIGPATVDAIEAHLNEHGPPPKD